jgi:predicted metal-dependent peptidase
MNDQQRNKRIDRAQLTVMFKVPFFAPAIAKLPVIWDDSVDTACTEGTTIWWNRAWFDGLKDEVVVTVLCHEAMHCLLGHLWRIPDKNEMEGWNEATDHSINTSLREFADLETGKHRADPFPMPDGDICCDKRYVGRAEEAIFAEIMRNRPPQGSQGNQSGKSGPGSGKSGPSKAGGGNPPPSRKKFGEMRAPAGTPDQKKKQATEWQATLMQSVAAAKQQGELPGCMERYVGELLHPSVPWFEKMAQWLREKAEDDWSWLKPNPYFDESGFMLPSLDSERFGTAVFATDTSGSINQEVLTHFQSVKQACLDEMKPSRLVDIYCDSTIQAVNEYVPGEEISRKAPGGGGTRFEPVFEKVNDLPEPPKLLVYLTDLQGSFPTEEPPFPVLWIVYGNKGAKAPFGEVVEVDE